MLRATITAVLLSIPIVSIAQQKYIGVRTCAPCHRTEKQGSQHTIWQQSKHAEAYKTLTTAKANEIAKAQGLTKPAVESKECLECHTLGKTVDAKLFERTFDIKEGVQCETCHGAGGGYRVIHVRDRAKAIEAGLVTWKDMAAVEQYCKSCHNEKSPTFKGFKFTEYWDKIKHPVPTGN